MLQLIYDRNEELLSLILLTLTYQLNYKFFS